LKVIITKAGEGPRVKKGDFVTIHYTGSLENGSVFDSSVTRGSPFKT
jgi:FKBP-type peptidyl-prolyl cis-trans isomerase